METKVSEQQRLYRLDAEAAKCMRELAHALARFYGLDRRCTNCDHFDRREETCGLTRGMRPPARVIAEGCSEWSEDDIPF